VGRDVQKAGFHAANLNDADAAFFYPFRGFAIGILD
jgi:hypothetical protein